MTNMCVVVGGLFLYVVVGGCCICAWYRVAVVFACGTGWLLYLCVDVAVGSGCFCLQVW